MCFQDSGFGDVVEGTVAMLVAEKPSDVSDPAGLLEELHGALTGSQTVPDGPNSDPEMWLSILGSGQGASSEHLIIKMPNDEK